MTNIIFIIFVILLILILIWLNKVKEGFETDINTAYENTTSPGGFSDNVGTSDGTTSSSYDTGATSGSYDTGATSGSYDTGATSGSYDTGSGSYDTGATSGYYDTGSGSYDTGATSGYYDTGTTSGSYDTGATSGSYDTGATSGSYDTGATSGYYDTGATSGSYEYADYGNTTAPGNEYGNTTPGKQIDYGTTPAGTTTGSQITVSAFNFTNFKNWSLLFGPNEYSSEIRDIKKHSVNIFNSKIKKDVYGFTQSPFNANYIRVRFDNTNNDYSTYDSAALALQTTIPELDAGNYLLSYYVQSRVSDIDAQSIGVYVAANNTSNSMLQFRTTDNQQLIAPGTWVKQMLSFNVIKSGDTKIQLVFQLFDTQTAADNMVAIGGVQLQYCGDAPCNVDCAYTYGDWSYCDFDSGNSTRAVYTMPPVNEGAVCSTQPPEFTQQKCFDSIHFANSDLNKSGWALTYNPASITSSVNALITTAATDTKFAFDNQDAQFSGPYTIINFDNTTGNLTSFTNPNITMQTSMRLAPGNYRMTYFVQSWDSDTDSQSIWITGVFGSTRSPSFNSKKTVVPGAWFPLAMEFTVGTNTKQPIPVQFQFILKDRTKGMNHAVAIGGINIVSCGENACAVDCQYIWDYWQECDTTTNMTYRDPLVITDADNGGSQCPMRDVSNCSVIPIDCQYSWGEWSDCVEGSTRRSRTQVTVTAGPHGKRCKAPQTETRDDCVAYQTTAPNKINQNVIFEEQTTPTSAYVEQTTPVYVEQTTPAYVEEQTTAPAAVDCQYLGWSEYPTCSAGIASRQRTAITRAPLNGGAECTPGATRDTTLNDCPVDCKIISQTRPTCNSKEGYIYYDVEIEPKNGSGKDCKLPNTNTIITRNGKYKSAENCSNCIYEKKSYCDGKNKHDVITITRKAEAGGSCKVKEGDNTTNESCTYTVKKKFTSDGTWTAPFTGPIQVLLVGGGGAGGDTGYKGDSNFGGDYGYGGGGGGGGGGVGVGTLNVIKGEKYNITVGQGGSYSLKNNGNDGGNSSFIGKNVSEIAYGGTGGASNANTSYNTPGEGSGGGSGGGGSYPHLSASLISGGSGSLTYYANNGGKSGNPHHAGGGGGGANDTGHNSYDDGSTWSDGGNGYTWAINGETYGGGGGGGAGLMPSVYTSYAGNGGSGGGGKGGGNGKSNNNNQQYPDNGLDNTGGGGGGCAWDAISCRGNSSSLCITSYPGNGGSGVVMIAY